MISDCFRLSYLGLPQEEAFELENVQPWEHIFYILWRFISTWQQSAWENEACYREKQSGQEWEILPQFWLAKQTGMNPCHSHACPNVFVPSAETAALLINSCEQGNDMQTLSRLDFFIQQWKYLLYKTYCLHILRCHSLNEATILWKIITEGGFYEFYVHTQNWVLNN